MGLCPSRHRCSIDVDVVFSFIELGDLPGLMKFTPSNFSWSNGSLPPLHFAILQGMSRGRHDIHLRIVEWMLNAGADPHHQAPYFRIPGVFPDSNKSAMVKLSVGPPNSPTATIEVAYAGHSAISLSVAWLKALHRSPTASHGQRGNSASTHSTQTHIQYFESILAVIARAMDARRTQASVDQGVINRWEVMRDMTETHNVTFETAGGAVTCHDIVLMAASPVLKALLRSPMKEAASKSIAVEETPRAGVALFLDILYMSATRSHPDYEAVLAALSLAHRWEVADTVHILSDLLRDMISEESFAAIAEAAAHQGMEALQRECAMFASKNPKVQNSQLSSAAWRMLGLSGGKAGEKVEGLKQRREEAVRWWEEIRSFQFAWRRRTEEANLVTSVTKADLLSFFESHFLPGGSEHRPVVSATFAQSGGGAEKSKRSLMAKFQAQGGPETSRQPHPDASCQRKTVCRHPLCYYWERMGASQGAPRDQMPLLPEPVQGTRRLSCASASRVSLPCRRETAGSNSGTLLTGVSLKAASQKAQLALPRNEKSPTVDSDVSTTDATGRSQDWESDTGLEDNWSPDSIVPRSICPEARVIILDWDDTLLPTGFLRDALKIYSNCRALGVATQFRRPGMMRKNAKSPARAVVNQPAAASIWEIGLCDLAQATGPAFCLPLECVDSTRPTSGFPCMAALEAHANLVRQVLTAARSLGHVAIVTLAERPWVHDSAEHYLPNLNLAQLLRQLDIPVYYAVEYRKPSRHPIMDTPPSTSKRLAMEDFLSTVGLPKGARYNLLSVGDSMAEREAARQATASIAKRASKLLNPAPLCKTVKFQTDPSLKMLSWELRGLLIHLKQAVELDSAGRLALRCLAWCLFNQFMGRGRPLLTGVFLFFNLLIVDNAQIRTNQTPPPDRTRVASEGAEEADTGKNCVAAVDLRGIRQSSASASGSPRTWATSFQQWFGESSPRKTLLSHDSVEVRLRNHQQGHRLLLFFLWKSLEPGQLQQRTSAACPFAARVGRAARVGTCPKLATAPNRWMETKIPQGQQAPETSLSGGTAALSQQLLQALPVVPQAAAPSTPVPSTTGEGADKLPPAMMELVAALAQQKEALPPQVQALLEGHMATDHKNAAKSLHRLVSQQSQARLELSNIRRARAQYTAEWNSYLAGLSDLLAKQVEIKNKSMKEFAEAEEKWVTQLSTATRSIQQASGSAQASEVTDLTMDEDAADAMEAEVARDAERESARSMAVERATDKEQALVEALNSAQQAAAVQAEQYRERTPRRSRPPAEEDAKTKGDAAEPPPRKVSHTIVDDRSFIGEFWAPFLGLCTQAEVALQDYLREGDINPFEGADIRLELGSTLWEGASQESSEVIPDLGSLTFQCSGDPHGTAGADATEEVRVLEEGLTSDSLKDGDGDDHPHSEPSRFCSDVLSAYKIGGFVHSFKLRPNLHFCKHPVPLRVRFADEVDAPGCLWARELSRFCATSRFAIPLSAEVGVSCPQVPVPRMLTGSAGSGCLAPVESSLSTLWPHAATFCPQSQQVCEGPASCPFPPGCHNCKQVLPPADRDLAGFKAGSCRALARPCHHVGHADSSDLLVDWPAAAPLAPRSKAPPLISDLQAMLASHVPLRPEWVSGPLLHMSPFEARWLADFLPSDHDRGRFTVFDCRLDLMSRVSSPEWSLLDYITAAIRSVPYRVRLVWYIVRPISDLPAPQFVVTAHDAPVGVRAIPVDLRGLGGLLHTIELGPGPLGPIWAELRAKGVDPGNRLEQAWLANLCEFRDEQDRRVVEITAAGPSPEWLVLSLTDPLEPVQIQVDYVGGAGTVLRVLHSPLDRLPILQVAATEMGWPAESMAVPFDLRGAGLQICTLVVGPGLTQKVLHEAVWTECTAGRSGIPDTVLFADSLGRTGDTRRPLSDAQFFVPAYPEVWVNDLAVTGLATDDTHSPTSPLSAASVHSCLGSTTTTTGAMQWAGVRISRQGVNHTAEYLLADHNQLVVFTAHSAEYGPLSPMGSSLADTLAPLLARILRRGHAPRMGFLQSSRVLPMNENRVWTVPVIWAERTGSHVHVIFDARCAQGELQMLTLPRGTVAEQVLPYALQSQGWALSVNGVAASCLRRSLETGDMIFLSRPNKPVPGFHFGHAVLLMPHLRVLTLPISLVDARSVSQPLSLAQTRDNSAIMRDELTRHINARIHLMGRAAPGLYPVTVMGMHHGPIMLYMPGPEPSLEHVQLVLDSIPEMPAGVQAFPCEAFPGETLIFVTADPEAGTATAIVASTLGFGLDNLISLPLLPTQQHLGTAVYLAPGYVAEPFTRPQNGHYIRRTRVSLPGSGTSMASLNSGLAQAKNARLCLQAHAKGIESPRCPVPTQHKPLPLPPPGAQVNIVTPLGRRKLPILKSGGDAPSRNGAGLVTPVQGSPEGDDTGDITPYRPVAPSVPVPLDLAALPLTAAPKSRDELKRCITDLKQPWFGFWQQNWGHVPALGADACAWLCNHIDFWRPQHRVHLFTDGSLLRADSREACGWGLVLAFEDTHTGLWTSGGFAGGSLQCFLDRPIGASNTSFDAEIAACLVALLWSFCLPQGVEVILWHDCKSAGDILCGACSPQMASSFVSLACRLRSVAVLAQQAGVRVQPQWIPSHSGIFFNDVVDAVAKAGARGDFSRDFSRQALPAATWKLLESPFLPWAWLVDYEGLAFPSFDSLASGVYESSDDVPADLLPKKVEPSMVPVVAELSLRLVTCNVQTFKDKRNIVLQQFLDRQIVIAGLQETRTTLDTRCNGADFFEFASAALRGEGGSSLFFARRHPYGWREGRPLFFEATHFQCVHAEAQVIAVQVRAPHLQLLCISAHAPHSGSPAGDVQQRWHQLAQAPWLRGQQGKIVIFLDGNAQVGTVQSDAIGTHAADPETSAGAFMRDWAERFAVCFPSTFCNSGGTCIPSAKEPTWFSPSGAGYRIDYVGVPSSWHKCPCSPSVLLDFELLNRDHVPAQVVVSLRISGRPAAGRRPAAFPRDPGDWPEESIEQLRRCIDSVPCLPWDLNVHQHVHCLIQRFQHFAAHCRPPSQRRCRAFVSEPTRGLLEMSKSCRRVLRQLKSLHQALLARAASGRRPVSAEGWNVADVQVLRQWVADSLCCVQRGLRTAIAADKGSYVRRAQARLRDANDPFNAKAFFAALKALRPPGKRVLKPFSGLIVDPEAPDDPLVRLRQQQQHFADLEAGTPADPSAFAAGALAVAPGQQGFSLKHLPTWVDIETSFRACRAGKTPGPDGLPDWLWKLAPKKSAELWMPVFLKAHVRLCEPIQFKHTILCTLFKGKGSPAAIENHRAIALLAGPGKILRKQLRPAILRQLPHDPLHQGGIPHSLLQGAQHVVRTHASFSAALGISSGALFLDVSSAYYRVLRQAFEGDLQNDTQVCQILQHLGVSPGSLQTVCAWLSGTNLMEGADEHEQLILRAYLSGSFFTLKHGGDVIRTRAGTRPGDSIADALFSLLQADFMAGLRQRMDAAGLLEDPITASSFGGPRLLAPIWADDTAVLLAHASADGLLAKTQTTLAFVHEEFTRRCMLPNYARGKSEVLLSPRGRGAPAVRLTGKSGHCGDLSSGIQVCQASGMAAPAAFLRVHRMLHFQRVCLTQPVLMDMLVAEASASKSSWLNLLRDDLAWLQSLTPLSDGVLRDFPNGLAEWCVHDRANYRSVLRKALTSVRSPLHEPEWGQLPMGNLDDTGGHHQCPKCDASFETFQALTAHLFAKHGTQCEAQEYSGSTLCRACMRQFWSRKRLVRHLQHDAPGCLRILSSHGIEVDRGQHRRYRGEVDRSCGMKSQANRGCSGSFSSAVVTRSTTVTERLPAGTSSALPRSASRPETSARSP
ncbi:hypothetical protein AK812_SmicGene12235 [Symbiodinium microadriaticum]|uniref:BTB domain-containing protein n=1 Tax=Symbiodinium microadriaticum TaxID=2951 RepID=A0A1Q9EB50_SYMMI|nr:hypothetical protein AK812_SmicGene12235 [Symbiodinium microadriaticum]